MSIFPDRIYATAGAYASAYFDQMAFAAATVDRGKIAEAGELLEQRARQGGTIFSCGNGGSAAIANHLVCDCLKGVASDTDMLPKVHSLSTTVELITAIGNDIGYSEIFAFQLRSMGGIGDVLVAISSSGASPNIVRALETARDIGIPTIAMTGFSGGEAASLADIVLHVASSNYGVIEDVHQSIMHILAQYLRHRNLRSPSNLRSLKF